MGLNVRMCLLTILVVMLANIDLSEGYRAFTVPGQPACFVSYRSQPNWLFKDCGGYTGSPDQLHCSTDHTCCYGAWGAECCVARNSLNRTEVTGIVIGCVFFVVLVVGLTVFISIKCFSKGRKK